VALPDWDASENATHGSPSWSSAIDVREYWVTGGENPCTPTACHVWAERPKMPAVRKRNRKKDLIFILLSFNAPRYKKNHNA
jgi:hypothetical protein